MDFSGKSERHDYFEDLYKENRALILNYIRKRVKNKEDAEDLTEEVFIRVYKNLPDFKWQGVSVKSWIFTIARNAIIDYYRKFDKEKNNVSLEEVSTNFKSGSKDILVNLLDGEEDKKLYLEISKLKEKDQFLIYYKYFEELSIKEIAKRVSMSESNVATRLHRLRKKILKSMK